MLWALGLFTASTATAFTARFLDRKRADWPLSRKLVLASVTAPLGWVIFQAAILPIALGDANGRARFGSMWPAYLRDVVLEPALKLWLCSGLCAAVLWQLRSRRTGGPADLKRGYLALYCLFLACGAVILLPIAMEEWINIGQLDARFVLAILAFAFLAGNLPVVGVAVALLYAAGAKGLRRIGEPFAAIYAVSIGLVALYWHSAVAARAGASAIVPVAAAALFGVVTGWIIIRRANRGGQTALSRN